MDYLNEMILGLEPARYTIEHLESMTTEKHELKALKPHILQWLEEEGYESSKEMVDKIPEQLEGYWDKCDVGAWDAALRCVDCENDLKEG